MIPKIDGSQRITEMKKDPTTASIPIIVLASRQSAAGLPPEYRANATIWKDIDIVTQLEIWDRRNGKSGTSMISNSQLETEVSVHFAE